LHERIQEAYGRLYEGVDSMYPEEIEFGIKRESLYIRQHKAFIESEMEEKKYGTKCSSGDTAERSDNLQLRNCEGVS
jgi:hypothetical protein